MRSFSRHLSSAALVFAGLLGLHSGAFALTTEHGSICKPYGNSNTDGLYSYVNGVYNYSGNYMSVICPVIRTISAPSGGYSVWVDGTAASGTTYCSLYSYDFTGDYKGVTSFSATGRFSRLLTLPASQVPYFSSQAVYCYMPNNAGLNDIEPVQ